MGTLVRRRRDERVLVNHRHETVAAFGFQETCGAIIPFINEENLIARYMPNNKETKEAISTKRPFLKPLYKLKAKSAPKIISKKLIFTGVLLRRKYKRIICFLRFRGS